MTIFIVTNGTGGEINSAWRDERDAQERADALNAGASFSLAWSVTATELT